MRAILLIPLLLSPVLGAEQPKDREAINQVIVALNNPEARGALFTKDADCAVTFDRLLNLHSRPDPHPLGVGTNESWRVLTVPRIVSGPIRFRSPNVAVVDGASIIRGAVTLAPRVPLRFVLKKQDGQWRIESVHRADDPPPAPLY